METNLKFDNGATYVSIKSDNDKTVVESGYKRGIGSTKVEGKDFNDTVWKHYWNVVYPKNQPKAWEEYEQWVKKNIKPVYKVRQNIKDDNSWVTTTVSWELYSNKVEINSYNRDGGDTTEGEAKTIDDFYELLKKHEKVIDGWGADNYKKFVKTWKSLRTLDTIKEN